MTQDLFVYGTLMNNEVLEPLLGCIPQKEAAELAGFECVAVKGAQYPGLKEKKGQRVMGQLLQGLTPGQLEVLDSYEGDEYRRIKIEVSIQDQNKTQATLPCHTYLFKTELHHLLSEQPWSNEAFRQQHMDDFIKRLWD